jgi:L-ascorbate metabolism protein UlaG (beta-lactamase superfamily)
MPKLYYQGHGSYRITADDKRVIYIDPYAGGGYDLPADIVLVTHQHHDHNKVELVTQKSDCRVISNVEALAGGKHNSFDIDGIYIEAVEAKNLLHNPNKCVGYIITVDGIHIYAAGDTSMTKQMKSFAKRKLDYALFPCDGKFNMRLKEAARCAGIVGAKNNIPIHLKPRALYDRKRADKWSVPNKLIIEPGQEIILHPARDLPS